MYRFLNVAFSDKKLSFDKIACHEHASLFIVIKKSCFVNNNIDYDILNCNINASVKV